MPRKKEMGRNANGVGTIRKKTVRKDGREYTYWEARCTVGYDAGTGKQMQRSITGKTQKEVAQKLKKMSVAVDEQTYVEPSQQLLGEWLDIWLETYVVNTVKPYTVDSYRSICKTHIKPAIGKVKLTQLAAPTIQQFYNKLLRVDDLSPKTIKNIHGVLHKALNQAVKIGTIRFNPADACDLPKVRRKEIVPLEEEDITAFMEEIQGHPYENLFLVTLFTGLRQGEVLGLTWDCVDFADDTIYINKQLQRSQKVDGEYVLVPTKNGKSRLISVAPSIMAVLKKQSVRQKEMRLLAGECWANRDNLVFTNEVGEHLVHFTVYKRFKQIVRNLGLDNVRFHDLRHSYAVAAIESGDDIKTVQGNLGHATASFTLDVYGHVSQKMRRQSADRMELFFHKVSGQ